MGASRHFRPATEAEGPAHPPSPAAILGSVPVTAPTPAVAPSFVPRPTTVFPVPKAAVKNGTREEAAWRSATGSCLASGVTRARERLESSLPPAPPLP